MLILNKRSQLGYLLFGCLFLAAFFSASPAQAISPNITQVKTKDSPAVYFLSHKYQRKKAYVNANSFLSYNNKWSDIKTISRAELDNWLDLKLIKLKDSPKLYYISGTDKTLILNLADLEGLGLRGEPAVEVSEEDFNQYNTVIYEKAGQASTTPENPAVPETPTAPEIPATSTGQLIVTQDLIQSGNNTLVSNTDGNLVGLFRFRASEENATITSITVSITGVYNAAAVNGASIKDENGGDYQKANVNWRSNNRQAIINFTEPLTLSAGEEKTIEVFLNFTSCSDCNNQTIRAEIKAAADIVSSSPAAGAWPLQGTEFKLVSGDSILGKVTAREKSLSGVNLIVNNGSRLIGKFTVSETTGREDVVVKEIKFSNSGSAGEDDWEDFRLLRNDQIIARVSELTEDGQIDFFPNSLRINQSSPAELTVLAGLKSDYNAQSSFNLDVDSLWSIGQNYKLSLQAEVDNLGETFSLD